MPGSGQTPFVQSFTYDPLNRLQSAVETVSGAQTWKQTNGFDRYGNRWIDSLNTTGNVMGPLTSQSDLSATNNRIVKAGYSYDLAGNMTAEPGKTYTFDGENKIATAVVGSTTTTYVYDGEGRRVKKTVSATVTRMVYNAAGELIAEYNGGGSLTKEYIYRGGEMIATVEPTNGTEYATADHLGTPRAWTNSSGAVVTGGRHDYLPFGEELFAGIGNRSTTQGYASATQADGQRKQFTSKERDTETNLDYFLARYYSSAQGRFTSPDEPFAGQDEEDPQTWNLYSYTSGNPLSRVDEDGRRWFYKCDKNGCEEPQWVNPNKDGTYTSPGEGWKEFVPRFQGDTLRILSADGTTAYHFGENRDGSPRAFSLQTGMVLDASWDIAGFFIPGKLSIKSLELAAATLWAKNLAKRAAVSTVEDLLKDAVKGKISKSIQYIKTGGMRQANKDFEALVGKSGATNRGGGLRTVTLEDGTKVNVRPFSSGGKPTLEIKPPTGKTVKIRYE